MLDIQKTTTQDELNILNNGRHWFYTAQDLVEHYVKVGKPFSSGELVAKLRAFRPDWIFSAFSMGESVRQWFNTGSFDLHRFQQYERHTSSNQLVYVYAPNKWSGETYDFEVNASISTTSVSTPVQNTMNIVVSNIDDFDVDVDIDEEEKEWQIRVSEDGRLRLRKGLVSLLLTKQGRTDKLTFRRKSSKSGLGIEFSTTGPEECLVEKDGRARIAGFDWGRNKTYTVTLSDLIG